MYSRHPSRSSGLKRSGAAALALLAACTAAAQPAPDARAEVERFEHALDEAVAGVGQARALPLLGGAGGARGFLVPGVGAVFVLPPQALPVPGGALMLRRGASRPMVAAVAESAFAAAEKARARADAARHSERARAAQTARQREGAEHAAEEPSDLERELREVEALARAYQREVERLSEQSERALLQLTEALRHGQREILVPLGPAPVPAAAPLPPVPPEEPATPDTPAPAPPAPLPPWRYWFEMRAGEAPETSRSAEDLVGAVRTLIVDTIERQGALLRTLRPDELVVVAVDFEPPALLAGDPAARSRRLVIKARKRDVEDHRTGRLSRAQLRERIEAVEY
jgi:hypothetical protein